MSCKARFKFGAVALVLLLLVCCARALPGLVHARAQAPNAPGQRPQQPTPKPTPIEEDVEYVETNLVNVLFNAVDKQRRFVTTLTQADLRVFEDDRPQQIATFERETDLPLALAILIDVSSSQDETLPYEQEAARAFVNSIIRPDQDTAAVVSFTGTATVEQDPTGDRAALERAINRLKIVPPSDKDERFEYEQAERAEVVPAKIEEVGLPGSTALWDAVWATSSELLTQTPSRARRALILLTDGDDTTSRMQREDAVTAAIKANAIIYAIGVEPLCDCPYDKKALRKVAEAAGGRAFFPEDTAGLNAAFAQIQQELRTQYLVAYAPTNQARDGSYRRIRLELVNRAQQREVKLTYREGYYANPPAARTPARTARPDPKRLPRPPRRPRRR